MNRDRFRELIRDGLTIPNAITLGKLALTPVVAHGFRENPRDWTLIAGGLNLSDNLDGALARLGDKHPQLQRFGLRSSELGRKADPFADKVFNGTMIATAMTNNVLDRPYLKTLGIASLAQKLAVGAQTIRHERNGIELHVEKSGKLYEFFSNVGFGTIALAEGIEDSVTRDRVKFIGAAVAGSAVAGAALQTSLYAKRAHEIALERQSAALVAE